MMRPRRSGKGCIVFSAYQYAPQHLLHTDQWNGIGLEEVARRIRARMPDDAKEGWDTICRGKAVFGPKLDEQAMDGAALWLAEHAAEIGARAPNSDERARAMG
eukprot:13104760-Alexandrium_andersonii.AAC.1